MELVEQLRAILRRVAGKCPPRQTLEIPVRNSLAARRQLHQSMPLRNPPQIFIGHWHRMPKRVKQNRVGCLVAHTGQIHQPLPQFASGCSSHRLQRSTKLPIEQRHKSLQRRRLPRNKSRRPDQPPQLSERHRPQSVHCERACRAKILERSLHGFPCGVLRQVCAQDHFERRLCRPPKLGTIRAHQRIVHAPHAQRNGRLLLLPDLRFGLPGRTSSRGVGIPASSSCSHTLSIKVMNIDGKRMEGSMKAHTEYLVFETKKRREMVHITDQVEQIVERSGVKDGLCFVSPMHITAAVYVNDNENGLIEDIGKWLEELAPARPDYRHHRTGEDNGDAHLKSLLLHHETTLPVTKGKLDLGTWQRIFYAEFDGQRRKRVIVKVLGVE